MGALLLGPSLATAAAAVDSQPPLASFDLPDGVGSVDLVRGRCADSFCPLTLVLRVTGAQKDRLSFDQEGGAIGVPEGQVVRERGTAALELSVYPKGSAPNEGGATIVTVQPVRWGRDAAGLLLRSESVVEAEGLPNASYAAVAVRGGKFAPAWRGSSYEMADESLEAVVDERLRASKDGSTEAVFSCESRGKTRRFVLRWDRAAAAFDFAEPGMKAAPKPPVGSFKLPPGDMSVDLVLGDCVKSYCVLNLVLKAAGVETDRLAFTDDRGMDFPDGQVSVSESNQHALSLGGYPMTAGPSIDLDVDAVAWGPDTAGFLLSSARDDDKGGNRRPTQYAALAVRGGKFARPWRGYSEQMVGESHRDSPAALVWTAVQGAADGAAAVLFTVENTKAERNNLLLRWSPSAGKFVLSPAPR